MTKSLQERNFRTEPSLRRGLTLRRLKVVLKKPTLFFENLKFMRGAHPSQEKHIFVLGPPRNGTTLMQRLISGHSSICALDFETRFFFIRNYTYFSKSEVPVDAYAKLIREARDAVDLFDRIARFHKDNEGRSMFLEKTPEHALRLKYLTSKFPNSKFILIVRDCRDGYLSAKRNPRCKVQTPYSYASVWRKSVRQYLGLNKKSFGSIQLVKYEDLCSRPEVVVADIMNFLGVPFEREQLSPNKVAQTTVSSFQGHQRLTEKISAKTVGQWKQKLNDVDRQTLMKMCGKEMKALGYTE